MISNTPPAPIPDERKDQDTRQRSSRYVRSNVPSAGLILQSRDLAVLDAVYRYRYLTSRQLHLLLFSPSSLRSAQIRLRRLWEHGYLERLYLPSVVGVPRQLPFRGEAVYVLAKVGADLLTEAMGKPIEHEALSLPAAALVHHLTASEFLVALASACRENHLFEQLVIEPEAELWRISLGYRRHTHRANYLVPDGAFTIRLKDGASETFYLEVVRADLKGGSSRLKGRMERYVEIHHAGAFQKLFGHRRIRAVLFLTTSEVRAHHLRQLAQGLRHGRRLFWFGAYEEPDGEGHRRSTSTPELILKPRWQSTEGELHSFTSSG